MMAHTFNPSTRDRGRGIFEFQAYLIYRVNARQVGLDRKTLP